MGTREDTISQGANWKGEVNTKTHGMYNKQEGGYNNNHEPPDKQHREPRERDEYEEVYHDVEVMETEFELTHTREEGQTMSDDEAIRGTNRSKSQETGNSLTSQFNKTLEFTTTYLPGTIRILARFMIKVTP
ncbi:hypothetical protein KY285_007610 [Solanum tuberosum]|nr:hypothetical protein KY284_007690 [Solanum tuberosum]KAH0745953.1 hypothetical protein KY285_007610 [Solanum tuberosum]